MSCTNEEDEEMFLLVNNINISTINLLESASEYTSDDSFSITKVSFYMCLKNNLKRKIICPTLSQIPKGRNCCRQDVSCSLGLDRCQSSCEGNTPEVGRCFRFSTKPHQFPASSADILNTPVTSWTSSFFRFLSILSHSTAFITILPALTNLPIQKTILQQSLIVHLKLMPPERGISQIIVLGLVDFVVW